MTCPWIWIWIDSPFDEGTFDGLQKCKFLHITNTLLVAPPLFFRSFFWCFTQRFRPKELGAKIKDLRAPWG